MNENAWRRVTQTSLSRRQLLSAGAAGSFVLFLSACSGSENSPNTQGAPVKAEVDGDLNLFNWTEYIDPEILEGFEEEYSVKVVESYFSGQDELIAKIASGAPYDVAIAGSHSVPKLIKSDLLMPLGHSELKNWDNLEPFFQDPPYDPEAQYTVPYTVGSNGIAWRTDKIEGEMTGSWNDLWDHPEAAGSIYVFDAMQMGLGASLLRLGYSVNSGDPTEIAHAADELIALKSSLGGFSSDDLTLLTNGQAWLTQSYSGSAYQALNTVDDPSTLQYQACKEGGLYNADSLIIPASAKAPGTAHLFIDWLLRPENAAKNVRYHGYPLPTEAGLETYKEMVSDFPFLAKDLELMDQPEMWLESLEGETLEIWNSEWSRVRAS